MNIRNVLFIFLLLIIAPAVLHAAEEYSSVYYKGNAPITIDGDLSDWEWLDNEWWNLGFVYNSTKPGLPKSDEDLSARFKCFYDSEYLYVAVKVLDDALVFDQKMFEQSYLDDSVEIYFDGYPENPSTSFDGNDGQVRVSLDENGNVTFEGYPMLKKFDIMKFNFYNREQFPFIWEKIGVKASLKTTSNGYVVEMSIPYRVLDWNGWEINRKVGMHVIVNDDDDGDDRESKIGWANDPENQTWILPKLFRTIEFSKEISMKEPIDPNFTRSIESAEERKISEDILHLLRTVEEEPEEGIKLLEEYEDELWALYLKYRMEIFTAQSVEEFINSKKTREKFMSLCKDEELKKWIKLIPGPY